MNINLKQIDDLNAVISVQITKDDYLDKVNNSIKDYAKKVNLPGFRKGKVPTEHVKKMHGVSILFDEVTKLINDSLTNYINENQLETLGQPLVKEDEADNNVFEIGNDFDFKYEVGLAPKFDVQLSSKDKVVKYSIEVDKETLEERILNLRRSFGSPSSPEKVEDADIVYGKVEEVDSKGNAIEGGRSIEGKVFVADIADKSTKKNIVGAGIGDSVVLDVPKAFDGSANLVARFLDISVEEAKEIKSSFKITISKIARVAPANLDQEFFDKIYGKDVVKNEKEFAEKVKEELADIMTQNSDVRLATDIREFFTKKFKLKLPETFLKKWLATTNKEISTTELDAGFPQFVERLAWELVENKIIKDNEIKIEYNDVLDLAKKRIEMQFKMYSPEGLPDNLMDEYTKQFLSNRENANRIFEEVKSQKVFEHIKSVITLDDKKITFKKFVEL